MGHRALSQRRSLLLAGVAAISLPGLAHAQAQSLGAAAAPAAETLSELVVTGSRIQRAGFDAPTPTTVISATDLRVGDRPNVAEVLNDLPQFRATTTRTTTAANTNNSVSSADLRGLGAVRTLTLLDGHRFSGSGDLSNVPQTLVRRVDIVTGGASAAWGSGAVSGVVNIILDNDLTGLTLAADAGTSSHDDARRYGYSATYGTKLFDDRAHLIIAGEFAKDDGAFDRSTRPNLISAIFQDTAGQLSLQQGVNYTFSGSGGVIIGGKAAMQAFRPDGSLSPLVLGTPTAGNFTVGGGGENLFDYVAVSSPYQRSNLFSRFSYDLNDETKLWVNAGYSRVSGDFLLLPEMGTFQVKADNPFLTSTAKGQLAALGATYPLTLGRLLTDVGPGRYLHLKTDRQNKEASLGIDGALGGGWTYSAYFDHGELRNKQVVYNQRITANFNNAIDAVAGPGGVPICRANAVTTTAPGCVPINLLGSGNISAAAVAYAFGAGSDTTTTKLDAGGIVLRGQPISGWAGPIDVALGLEARREAIETNYIDPISLAGGRSTRNAAPLNGSFDVKEAFGEINVPLLDLPDLLHVEANGAARYSDYSTSGGIWSWKYGATARVAHDLLLRGTYSRDIRSPSISELYTKGTAGFSNVQDPFQGVTQALVKSFAGGNANLVPEIGYTMTVGSSWSPHQIPGLSFSVDYYDINIQQAIATLSLQDTLTGCFASNPRDPTCHGVVARTPGGAIDSVQRTFRNLADYRTKGVDLEASYLFPLDQLNTNWDGSLRFRLLANHVNELLLNDGVRITNVAGVVGDTTTFSTPKWRQTATVTYQKDDLTLDLRLHYVGGGIFSRQLGPNGQPISNNRVDSRTYTDLGVQYKVKNATFYASVVNLFDVKPPNVTISTAIYDEIGRYYSGGVKLRFW